MKKRILLIVPIVILCMMVFVKQTDAGYPTLDLTSDAKTISAGQKTQLKVGGVKSNKIKWTSSNKKVATVSKKGVVTGVSAGKSTIKGTYKGVKFIVKFTVVHKEKKYDMLLCKDKNMEIYLTKIKNGKIYLKLRNKTSKKMWVYFDYFYLNKTTYPNSFFYQIVEPYSDCDFQLELCNDDWTEWIDYYFSGGYFKGQISYTSDDSEIYDVELKFSTTIK